MVKCDVNNKYLLFTSSILFLDLGQYNVLRINAINSLSTGVNLIITNEDSTTAAKAIKSFTIGKNDEQEVQIQLDKSGSKCVVLSATTDDDAQTDVIINQQKEVTYCFEENKVSDIFNINMKTEQGTIFTHRGVPQRSNI